MNGWWDRELAEQVGRAFDGAPAEGVMEWALDRFAGHIALTASMTDAVLIDMASRLRPGVPVMFLDTGYHFAETIGTAAAVEHRYPIRLLRVAADLPDDRLYLRDPDRCCALRKVRPLHDALAPYAAWVSGIRRDETSQRAASPVVGWDDKRGKVKINPLAEWGAEDVERYIREHDVVVNPLLGEGFDSVGCRPCTLPGLGRAGRWAGLGKTECGIHA